MIKMNVKSNDEFIDEYTTELIREDICSIIYFSRCICRDAKFIRNSECEDICAAFKLLRPVYCSVTERVSKFKKQPESDKNDSITD